jgi:uncharacterized protein YihD (DUF1040 family)
MQDPKRIDSILEQLRTIWQQEPDLRLGQLIVIATKPSESRLEVFNIEDERLAAGLAEYSSILSASRREDF